MTGNPTNSKGLGMGEKTALLVSVGSLLISVFSLWESDVNRRSNEEAARKTQRFSEQLARPWVAFADVAFSGQQGAEMGLSFTLKNSGSSPALNLEVAPGITLDAKESLDLSEIEKEGTMAAGTVPPGGARAVIMLLPNARALRRGVEGKSSLRYAVSWEYSDVYGDKHTSRQFGHWHTKTQMFVVDASDIH